MKLLKLNLILNVTALVFTAVSVNPVFAQMNMDHGKMNVTAMPGMTMVFSVKDRTVLEKIEVGQKVQFMVVQENGKMMVTDIQVAK